MSAQLGLICRAWMLGSNGTESALCVCNTTAKKGKDNEKTAGEGCQTTYSGSINTVYDNPLYGHLLGRGTLDANDNMAGYFPYSVFKTVNGVLSVKRERY